MAVNLTSGFNGANLKVERANRHIDELKAVIDEIGRTKPYSPSITQQGQTWSLSLGDLGSLGPTIPLIIGDAVHNLRAALDRLWGTLARSAEPDKADIASVKFATFPFHETPKNVEDAVKKGAVKVAFPQTEDLILNQIKPYRDSDGNSVLWSITKLDKIDKHNLIIPIITATRIPLLRVTSPMGHDIQFTDCTFANSQGSFIGMAIPLEMQQQGELALEIAFPQDNVLGGEPVFPTLLNMSEATTHTVNLFREAFG
jgi:hypothetical protein